MQSSYPTQTPQSIFIHTPRVFKCLHFPGAGKVQLQLPGAGDADQAEFKGPTPG